MIELNLTYEESKKILELGYDFTEICTVFTYAAKVSFFKIPMTNNVYTDGIKFYEEGSQEGFISIIPKAALEACLPELSGSTWLKNLRTNWMILDLDPHIIKLESIFKAFLWCHENYPEELKKKFEEVMGCPQ